MTIDVKVSRREPKYIEILVALNELAENEKCFPFKLADVIQSCNTIIGAIDVTRVRRYDNMSLVYIKTDNTAFDILSEQRLKESVYSTYEQFKDGLL